MDKALLWLWLGLSLQEAITLLIAISALIFSGWQLLTQKSHNKLSVKPYLSLRHNWKDGVRTVSIKNVGLGPAVITDHLFKYKKKVVPFSVAQDIINIAEDLLGGGYYSRGTPLETGQVIELGESVIIFGVFWHEQHDQHNARDAVISFLEDTEITVEYKSMYDQKLKLDSSLESPDDYHF